MELSLWLKMRDVAVRCVVFTGFCIFRLLYPLLKMLNNEMKGGQLAGLSLSQSLFVAKVKARDLNKQVKLHAPPIDIRLHSVKGGNCQLFDFIKEHRPLVINCGSLT